MVLLTMLKPIMKQSASNYLKFIQGLYRRIPGQKWLSSLGKPVLVSRETTEWLEAITAGTT